MVDYEGLEIRHDDNASTRGGAASFVDDLSPRLVKHRVEATESRRLALKTNKVVVSLVLISIVLVGVHAVGVNIGPWQHFVSEARGFIRFGNPLPLAASDACAAKHGVTPEPYEDFEGGLNPRALPQVEPTLRPCLEDSD